jgi:hypothetical protein
MGDSEYKGCPTDYTQKASKTERSQHKVTIAKHSKVKPRSTTYKMGISLTRKSNPKRKQPIKQASSLVITLRYRRRLITQACEQNPIVSIPKLHTSDHTVKAQSLPHGKAYILGLPNEVGVLRR